LCQFDIAYCFIVAAEGIAHGSGYPSSAAFNEDRAKPIAQKIAANSEVRGKRDGYGQGDNLDLD
jgi:hypothetical protein